MKKLKKMELNARLLLVFFTAVFLLSVVHFFVYAHLFNTMKKEEAIINQQQAASAKMRLDTTFSGIQMAYQEVVYDDLFFNTGKLQPEPYQLAAMRTVAEEAYLQVPEIGRWFIYLHVSDQVLSTNGVYDSERYFSSFCSSKSYTLEFWQELLDREFYRIFLPEEEHFYLNIQGHSTSKPLVPMVIRPYFNYSYTTVFLLDMDLIFREDDAYLGQTMYLFSEDGTFLYTTDTIPIIDVIPESEKLTGNDGTKYAVQQWTTDNGIRCVKLLKEDISTDIVRNSFTISLIVAISALAVIAILVPTSVKTLLHPVNRMLGMLRQHTGHYQSGNIHSACEELEQILLSREQQTAALAQRDATLSEYFLQSRLKNVYVDMEQQEDHSDGTAYILYIQVQYHENARNSFTVPRAELESCLQEMMSGVLSRLFDTTMLFQLEPGRFAARVTVSCDDRNITSRMDRFMKRLEEERDFAWFTVVQSQLLTEEVDLASVYVQVQEAARQALVRDESQLLTLPVREADRPGFRFARQDEQKLFALVRSSNMTEAVELARELLEKNLESGITHTQMEMLCIAIVNTVSYAMTELTPSAEKLAAASGVYNTLTSKCSAAREYISAVLDFICSADTPAKPAQDDQLLNAVQQYLEENYHREFSGEEMAAALWVSRSYLSSYYKNKTGMNLSESIQLFRIQKAVELLKDPDITIGEIGTMVGMPSSNTFLRHFRKYTGMTPKEYRLKNTQ